MTKTKQFTNWESVPIIMSLQTACIILSRSYDSLQKHSLKGDFPAFRNGDRIWSVNKTDLIAWIESQKVSPPLPQST